MAIALVRTAYSNNLKNSMDMSCALCDAEGRLIAQGLTLPLHLGSVPDAMAAVKRKFHGKIRPGDVFILNDPFEGGTHLPDFYILKPIHVGGRSRRLVGEHRPPARRRREDAGRERLRRDRDLPGGPPHPAGPPLRRGRAGRGGVRLHRQERARAAPGAGRRPLAGGRVPHGRARLPRACSSATDARGSPRAPSPPRPGGAAGAERHQGHAGRRLPLHGSHRRRRHRPGSRSRSR